MIDCQTCGATIRPDGLNRHVEWHEQYEELVARVVHELDGIGDEPCEATLIHDRDGGGPHFQCDLRATHPGQHESTEEAAPDGFDSPTTVRW